MEADIDDIATDFGNESIDMAPKDQFISKQNGQKDWDESKFEKKLHNQISKQQQKQPIDLNQQISSRKGCKHSLNQTILNDKNNVTHTSGENEHETFKTEEISKTIKQSVEEKQQQKQENLQERLEGLAITQKTQNNQISIISSESHSLIVSKQYSTEPQLISNFSPEFKSSTITLDPKLTEAQQSKFYFQNTKLILTSPISSLNSSITFRLDNIKYCVGIGVGLKEILERHNYDYKSTTETQMGHGLYLVTSQGYSWSHSEEEDDDAFRNGWNLLYSGVNVKVKLQGENLHFKWKKGDFSMVLPSRIREKYTLCFCAYLHQKTEAISIVPV